MICTSIKQLTDEDWDTMRNALIFTIAALNGYDNEGDFRKECKRLLQILEGRK